MCWQKSLRPARQRELSGRITQRYQISQRRACRLLLLHRSTCRYTSWRPSDEPLRMRLRELAMARPRYGYRRPHLLLGREGWRANLNKVLRVYREEGLLVRTRRRRKVAAQARVPLEAAARVHERWSLDFMSDQLASGQRFRILNVIDQLSRECLASEARFRFPAEEVTRLLERLIAKHGSPESQTVDNGIRGSGPVRSDLKELLGSDWVAGHHQGRHMNGRTPYQVFQDALPKPKKGSTKKAA